MSKNKKYCSDSYDFDSLSAKFTEIEPCRGKKKRENKKQVVEAPKQSLELPKQLVQKCNNNLKVDEAMCLAIRNTYAKILGGTIQNVSEIGTTAEGVCTYSIDFNMPPMFINGFPSQSPLANYALGSAEVSTNPSKKETEYLNLFEVMIPDFPNWKGSNKSSVQTYAQILAEEGLPVATNHYHWAGTTIFAVPKGTPSTLFAAIHSQNIGMNPVRFAEKIARALRCVGMTIQQSKSS
jgi:hypothetical protein